MTTRPELSSHLRQKALPYSPSLGLRCDSQDENLPGNQIAITESDDRRP